MAGPAPRVPFAGTPGAKTDWTLAALQTAAVQPAASGICNWSWPSTRATTTDGAPIAAASSARPGPARPDYSPADLSQEQIKHRLVLGGLINEYERAA